VCVYGLNSGSGRNALLGCRTVDVPPSSPIGNVDGQNLSGTTLTLSGWALDKDDLTAALQVRVQVNGTTKATNWTGVVHGAVLRPDIDAAFPGAGNDHGWRVAVPLTSGSNQVCAYGRDLSGNAPNGLLGACRNVTVP
jgi:hypothetical protein